MLSDGMVLRQHLVGQCVSDSKAILLIIRWNPRFKTDISLDQSLKTRRTIAMAG
jgi:hypothetical protein